MTGFFHQERKEFAYVHMKTDRIESALSRDQTWALAVLPPVSHKFSESCVLYVFHEIAFHSLKGPIANSK